MGLAISYALSVTDRLSGMVTSFTETEKQMVSVERAVQYIEDVPPEVSPRGTVSIDFPSIFYPLGESRVQICFWDINQRLLCANSLILGLHLTTDTNATVCDFKRKYENLKSISTKIIVRYIGAQRALPDASAVKIVESAQTGFGHLNLNVLNFRSSPRGLLVVSLHFEMSALFIGKIKLHINLISSPSNILTN